MTLWSYDISSAYPYALTLLPCLDAGHGAWVHERATRTREVPEERATLVRYAYTKSADTAWAPLPFRDEGGNICFPRYSDGGYVWRDEFAAAQKLVPGCLRALDWWTWRPKCRHRPFKELAAYYRYRASLGKDARGIAIKLGMNSCYGKLAQSVGSARYQSWVWAGMTTSITRAMILALLSQHRDLASVISIATDGIYTTERLCDRCDDAQGNAGHYRSRRCQLPRPKNTGTFDLPKPLGAWEEKRVEGAMFFARPGVYFPLGDLETRAAIADKEVKARGVGRKNVADHWGRIVSTFVDEGIGGTAKLPGVTRFCGAKTSISLSSKGFRRADGKQLQKSPTTTEKPCYGRWVDREVRLTFDPKPKRETPAADYRGEPLSTRDVRGVGLSAPYKRAWDALMQSEDDDGQDDDVSDDVAAEQPQ